MDNQDQAGSFREFNPNGVLPPGDYRLTLNELRKSLLGIGGHATSEPTWDTAWRLQLVDNLEVMINQLWQIGIDLIFIDGSFVEDKDHPNDIDGYFVCDFKQYVSGQVEQQLNEIDPLSSWTWNRASRTPYRGYAKPQLPMWHNYRVELYPHYGQGSGIRDRYGNEQTFPAAFRKSRTGNTPKGIVQILKEEEKP